MNITDEEVAKLLIAAEKKAGELVMHAHGIMAEQKTDARNVVTEYDRKVQDLLMAILSEAVPGAHFFCEEMEHPDSLSAEHVFIIDPIDGTMNFVKGLHHSCISIAYMRSGALSAAAVYNPYADEMFSAVRGKGACLNGEPIRMPDAPMKEGVACFGTAPYYADKTDKTFRILRAVFDNSLDIRREGSAALDLCSVAAGRAGIFFEMALSLWDFAAGALIVEEAGGRACMTDGQPFRFDEGKPSVLAGSPRAVEDFLRLTEGL